MSRKKNISYIFSLASLLLAACDTESTIATPLGGEEAIEVQLKATVCTVETSVNSRGIINGTTLDEGVSIGIFGLKSSKENFTAPYLQNLECLYEAGGNLKPQTGGKVILYPAGQDALHLYGYYPYTATPTTDENGEISIPVKGTSGKEDVTDYLFTGVVTGSKQSAMADQNYAIPVSLKHAMSILRINLYTETPEYTVDSHPTLLGVSFTPRESQTGSMNLRTGTITSENSDNTASVSLDYNDTPFGIIANGTPVVKEYLLFPHKSDTNSAIRKLILNIKSPEGIDKEIIVFDEAETSENRQPVIVRLEAGHITTINIKYSQSMVAKADVNQWVNGEAHTFE